ncbi:MAG: tRNA 2-thiouridine(34) synthase MnmA [Bacteroidales bacterium]|jgi:tRNA-specific 2-thiouridylase|nr:tRNA 2-thiouridine(34) synthase MnmA [Bacteroidales bacterium]
MNIAALVSGGVDSSVVVHLLKEQGHNPHLFYLKISNGEDDCSWEDDIIFCRMIARKYGCKLDVLDLNKEYWDTVVAYMIETVRMGRTPNPDMMCNKYVKFGYFEQLCGKNFDKIATGHYATTAEVKGKTYLATAKDPVKDQTDFLAQINYLQVSKLLFPVGNFMKSEVRSIAEASGLSNAKRKDSQGICFLGKVNYNEFIERHLGHMPGNIIELETGKKLGRHNGFWFHTIGQRKGLGLSGGPWFVVKKDVAKNIIYVANGYDPEEQYGTVIDLQAFNFITEDPWGDCADERDITFKLRHTPEFTRGKLTKTGEGLYRIIAAEKQQGIASGQFGVIYDKNAHLCFGSGEIV